MHEAEGCVISLLMSGRLAEAFSGEEKKKKSSVLISLSRSSVLLVITLELNEVSIAGVPSLLAGINIYRLLQIRFNSSLVARACFYHQPDSRLNVTGFNLDRTCHVSPLPACKFCERNKWRRALDGQRWPHIFRSCCRLSGSKFCWFIERLRGPSPCQKCNSMH